MTAPRKPWSARRIHLWIAIIMAIPMTLMAVTGILISVRSVTSVTVPLRWMGGAEVPDRLPITAFTQTSDGTRWVGHAQGLHAVTDVGAREIEAFRGQEIVGLAALAGRAEPLVATRMAIWNRLDGQWHAVRRGRVRQLVTLADGSVLGIAGGRGEFADGKPLITQDGEHWGPYEPALGAQRALPRIENPVIPLHQAMRELHSGAYLFGKGPGEIAWSNIIGWVLVALSLTGLWMWLRRERERALALRQPASVPAGAVGMSARELGEVSPRGQGG